MWTPVNKIIIFGILFGSTRMLVGAISVIYLVTKGLDVSDIALLKTFQMFIMFMFDMPLAYLSDKRSKKLSIILASLFSSIWLFLIGNCETLKWFYVAEFFNAISLSLFNGAFIAYLINMKKYLDDNNTIKAIIGQYNKYHFIGMGLAAYLGSALATNNINNLWFLSSALMFTLTITFSFLLPIEPKFFEPHNNRSRPIKELFDIFKDLFLNSENNVKVLLFLFVALYYQIIIQFWQLMLSGEDIGYIHNTHHYGLAFVSILLAQSIAGFIVEKFSLKIIVLSSGLIVLFIFSLSQFIALDSKSMIFLLPLLFMLSKIMMIFLQADVHDRIPSELRATYDSVISTSGKVMIFFILPFIGYAMKKLDYEITNLYFILSLSFIFVVFSFLTFLHKRKSIL